MEEVDGMFDRPDSQARLDCCGRWCLSRDVRRRPNEIVPGRAAWTKLHGARLGWKKHGAIGHAACLTNDLQRCRPRLLLQAAAFTQAATFSAPGSRVIGNQQTRAPVTSSTRHDSRCIRAQSGPLSHAAVCWQAPSARPLPTCGVVATIHQAHHKQRDMKGAA